MNDIFYANLGQCSMEIKQYEKDNNADRKNEIFEAIDLILTTSNLARKEGLLALEEFANGDSLQDGVKSFFRDIILLIVDGTAPDLLDTIVSMRYQANGFTDYDALQILMFWWGALSIQAGENPIIIETGLCAMLPDKVAEEYRSIKAAKEEERRKQAKIKQEGAKKSGSGFLTREEVMELLSSIG